MFGFGFGELVLMLLIVVVVFGATKLPDLGRGIGNDIERWREQQRRERFRQVFQIEASPWTLSEWALVIAALALVAIVMARATS